MQESDDAAATDGRTPPTPGTGSLIAGRYLLVDTIGQGGMGVVWRARDQVLARAVAVKQLVLPPGLSEDDRQVLRERVLREARAAARVQDPSAVTVYDVVTDGDSPYLVMELVDATSLGELIRSEGPRPVAEVVTIGLAVLDALQAAHAVGITHRDVKPGNVMMCANGRILLADFGIASSQGDSSITQTGLLLGSPAYIAPERAQGQSGGPASDLWALGATLYTAVEGVPAYDGDSPLLTLTAVVHGRRRAPQRAGPLGPVLDALLAAEPASRPDIPTARQLLQRLRPGQAEPTAPRSPVPVHTPSAPAARGERTQLLPRATSPTPAPVPANAPAAASRRRSPRTRRRRRALIALPTLALALAVAALAALYATGVVGGGRAAPGSGTVPAGWMADDESDFRLYHPADWKRLSVPGGGSAYGQSGSLYERVLPFGDGDPLALLTGLDKQKAARPGLGYHRVRLAAQSATLAELEWTEVGGGVTYHLVDHALRARGRVYTVLFFVDDARWAATVPTFDAIFASFTPGS